MRQTPHVGRVIKTGKLSNLKTEAFSRRKKNGEPGGWARRGTETPGFNGILIQKKNPGQIEGGKKKGGPATSKRTEASFGERPFLKTVFFETKEKGV